MRERIQSMYKSYVEVTPLLDRFFSLLMPHVSIYVCIRVCMYAFMYVRMQIGTHVYIYQCIHMCICMQVGKHVYTRTRHAYMYINYLYV